MNGILMHADKAVQMTEVIGLIYRNNADAVVIRENGIPKGLITPMDIVQLFALNKDPGATLAGEVMNSPIISVEHNADVAVARDMMTNQNLKVLPVRMEYDIIGLVVANDLLSI